MPEMRRSPAELRSMFGENLRILAEAYPSISELSRQLGINRTQFNRYLSGESFPRPDVLSRICDFFDVDARVLLEPVQNIASGADPLTGPFLKEYVGVGVKSVDEDMFPTGFYRFSRRSFLEQDQYVTGLVRVFRDNGATVLRGYETRAALSTQGMSVTRQAREFRGLVLQQEDGVSVLISRRGAHTASFNYLSRVTSFENNFWVGYVTRTIKESIGDDRIVRMVYEYLGTGFGAAKEAARRAGYCTADELAPFERRLLKVGEPFA
ncbi:helix-turn-helix domain-containing protein [Tateyamaria omphalii]|uniref:Transcriptional regulator n=1 Tax=Tateyamaria omphalii TaxID=299262 RepID=A0A1P8MT31_9RHOB|nr:helix-turn-helix transcriptional regulator [Tateyamaria omphalii]APX11257.1 transcriptional regulator [Tateyamaria omphalii]